MKKFLFMLITSLLLFFGFSFRSEVAVPVSASVPIRGIWVATVSNLDFPKNINNPQAQKTELIQLLDLAKDAGMNAVFFQVRAEGDALYASSINPWSKVLTGTPGKDPGYDPLAFLIEEGHKRGLQIHAWLNPYRVTTAGTDVSTLSSNHPARLHPSWTISYANSLCYNPELPEVKQLIQNTIKEIVTQYDVDGIHFDDYFYPSALPLPEGEGPDGTAANLRRAHVNDMVATSYQTVKAYKPNAQFGISPVGIWKNSSNDPAGSDTKGRESYYAIYCDTLAWIKEGIVDYIAPQIYWATGTKVADYETLVAWWAKQVENTNVSLYIGQGIYKEDIAAEIEKELAINEKYPAVKGSIFFRLQHLADSVAGCKETIRKFYQARPIPDPLPNETPPLQSSDKENIGIPQYASLKIDNNEYTVQSYNIQDHLYFQLRDMAGLLTNTKSQFDTLWDTDNNTIKIITDTPYTSTGDTGPGQQFIEAEALPSQASITLNGQALQMEAYNIQGYTYFKLRDLALAVDFSIDWQEDQRQVIIHTEQQP